MLPFIANNANVLLALGYFGLMWLCIIWLARRGWRILQEGTYYRTMFESIFRWNRVYRYGTPVYVVAYSSIGGAVIILISSISKLFRYPLEFPFWWMIPFESVWQGISIPILGYILGEWLYKIQRTRKAKRNSRYHRYDFPIHAEQFAERDETAPLDVARLEDIAPHTENDPIENSVSTTQQYR